MNLKSNTPVLTIIAILLVAVILVAALSVLWPKSEEQFLELGLLGKNRTADNYYPNGNSTLNVDSEINWYVYVHNHMGVAQNVYIRIKLVNSTSQLPDDQKHTPSSADTLYQFVLPLAINDTAVEPFSWSIQEIDHQNDSIVLRQLKFNNQLVNVNIPTSLESSYWMIFELWVYNQGSSSYQFSWANGGNLTSASVYVGFRVNLPNS